jgi:hypothetical protein
MTISNDGPATATNARVVAPNVTGISRTAIGCVHDTGAECPTSRDPNLLNSPGIVIPKLAPGGSVTLIVVATADENAASGTFTNNFEVAVAGGNTDPNPDNNRASADLSITQPVASYQD